MIPARLTRGKRFLLTSPSVVTTMLDQLGVDVVTLGNNHLNDWEIRVSFRR